MKLSVNQENLSAAVGIVARAVENRTTMPILSNVLLETDGQRLRVAATNREIGINCWIGAQVDEPGAITVPARLLGEFVNSLPPDRIDMDLIQRTLTLALQCGRFKANIKGIAGDEFPLLPTYKPTVDTDATVTGDTYEIDPALLSTMISNVAFAASTDENRPTLTGVEVTLAADRIAMAATDGYRLSMDSIDVDGNGDEATVIVPAKSLGEVQRIAANAESMTVVVSDKRNQALFSATGDNRTPWQRVDVVSELIDTKYPDYRGTIPKAATTTTIVDTAALLQAVQVANLFARDNAGIIRFSVVPDAGVMRLAATSAEMGNYASEMEVEINGDAIEIALNGSMLRQFLTTASAPRLTMETTSATRPALFRQSGNQHVFIQMPMSPPK